jgi:hypothetical protein
MRKNAQVAIEFLLLMILLFSVFMVYTVSTRNDLDNIRKNKDYVLLVDVTKMVQYEIVTASKVKDGYHRTFEIPETLDGTEYTIETDDMLIIAGTEEQEFALFIPDINGSIKKGYNTITKENGTITIQ